MARFRGKCLFRVLPEVFRDYGLCSVKNVVIFKPPSAILFFKCAQFSCGRMLLINHSPQNSGATFASSPVFDWGIPTVLDSVALMEIFTRFFAQKRAVGNIFVSTKTSKARLLAICCCCRRHATAPTRHISRPSTCVVPACEGFTR